MVWRLFCLGWLLLLAIAPARAIEDVGTSPQLSPPTSSNIPNWTTGWVQPPVQPAGFTTTTGWNYVGSVNGDSAVYLGNGWVITCAHVQAGNLTLNGVVYPMVSNSAQTLGPIDLVLFEVSPSPLLPPLPLRSADPVAFSSPVAMLGFGIGGGNRGESWGFDTVTEINQSITPSGTSFVSNDFLTLTGSSTSGGHTVNNAYQVDSGDSGGGDFIFNTTTNRWELAGINEVMGTVTFDNGSQQGFSGFVQIDTYAQQIQAIIQAPTDTPTLPQWALIALAGLLIVLSTPGARNALRR
ncbi:MAG: trypsin-like peptidase domain-containing protein [Verrucomicrobiota bacterium]